MNKKYFDVTLKKLFDGSVLHIIDIRDITPKLEGLIDQNITQIHSANDYDLDYTKKALRKTFGIEKGICEVSDVKMGAIAEFFVHLYCLCLGFKQECLFQSLEELNGIKKGHDGYYSFNNDEWLMESKSTRTGDNHEQNIKRAYKDLEDKVSGKNKNSQGKVVSPWDNALKHARMAKSNEDILKNLKRLSKDFLDEKYHDIKDFNIIPSSTVFLNNEWKAIDVDKLYRGVNGYMKQRRFAKLNVVCVTQRTIDLFLVYLNK